LDGATEDGWDTVLCFFNGATVAAVFIAAGPMEKEIRMRCDFELCEKLSFLRPNSAKVLREIWRSRIGRFHSDWIGLVAFGLLGREVAHGNFLG